MSFSNGQFLPTSIKDSLDCIGFNIYFNLVVLVSLCLKVLYRPKGSERHGDQQNSQSAYLYRSTFIGRLEVTPLAEPGLQTKCHNIVRYQVPQNGLPSISGILAIKIGSYSMSIDHN